MSAIPELNFATLTREQRLAACYPSLKYLGKTVDPRRCGCTRCRDVWRDLSITPCCLVCGPGTDAVLHEALDDGKAGFGNERLCDAHREEWLVVFRSIGFPAAAFNRFPRFIAWLETKGVEW